MSQPVLETSRLVLRAFTPADAADVQRLAGDPALADTTQNIPHPYEDGMAEEWIGGHKRGFEDGTQLVFAITFRGALVGAISLAVDRRNNKAELGYWVGKPFWNRGYASEAVRALIDYGFDVLGLHRIEARHLARNPASGRVMQKAGMSGEGLTRQSMRKGRVYEDLVLYGILRDER